MILYTTQSWTLLDWPRLHIADALLHYAAMSHLC